MDKRESIKYNSKKNGLYKNQFVIKLIEKISLAFEAGYRHEKFVQY